MVSRCLVGLIIGTIPLDLLLNANLTFIDAGQLQTKAQTASMLSLATII
jgi:hypothetical protein